MTIPPLSTGTERYCSSRHRQQTPAVRTIVGESSSFLKAQTVSFLGGTHCLREGHHCHYVHITLWRYNYEIVYSTSSYLCAKRLRWSRGSVLALVHKFAVSKPAEAEKNLSTPSSGREVKPFVHVAYLRHVKEPESVCVEVAAYGRNYRPFLAQVVSPFITRVSDGDTWRCKYERLKKRVCTLSFRLQCIRGH